MGATPCVQHTEEAELAALQRPGRRADITDRLGTGIEDSPVAIGLRTAQHTPQLRRNRDGDEKMMHRHQPRRLSLKPGVSLLFITVWTVTIAAGSSDPVLATTTLTFVFDVAELAGSTASDRADHFLVSNRDVITKLLQVGRCVLPKAVRDRGHRLTHQSPKDSFDGFACIGLSNLG